MHLLYAELVYTPSDFVNSWQKIDVCSSIQKCIADIICCHPLKKKSKLGPYIQRRNHDTCRSVNSQFKLTWTLIWTDDYRLLHESMLTVPSVMQGAQHILHINQHRRWRKKDKSILGVSCGNRTRCPCASPQSITVRPFPMMQVLESSCRRNALRPYNW